MKVLMLGWELPPNNSGGLGVASYQLCKALNASGADIEFILPVEPAQAVSFMKVTPAYTDETAKLFIPGLAYQSAEYYYKHSKHPINWTDLFTQEQLYSHAVESMVQGRSFDVIHAHDWLTFRAGLKAKQRTGWPLIVHVHSVEADRAGHRGGGNPLVREIEALGLMMADRVIAVSRHTRQSIIEEYGIPDAKIEVVHNSLDRQELEALDADNAYRFLAAMRSQGYKVVVNVGRLTIQKGLPSLLRAARAVLDKLPKTFFLIVGSGEQYDELIGLAGELGILNRVLFTGFQRGKNWRDAYAISDLFVMPSISEPFGLTPLEALHYGTPSLISYQSGVSEVLLNCLKADFWDVREMANQIVGVLSNQPLHDMLRNNGMQELEHLTWDEPARKLLKVYESHVLGGAI